MKSIVSFSILISIFVIQNQSEPCYNINIFVQNVMFINNTTAANTTLSTAVHYLQLNSYPVTIQHLNNFNKDKRRFPVHCSRELVVTTCGFIVVDIEDISKRELLQMPRTLQPVEPFQKLLHLLLNLSGESERQKLSLTNFQGIQVVVKVGYDVDLDHKDNVTVLLDKIVDFSKVEEIIPRQHFRSSGTRLYFLWAILQKRFNLTSVTLKRYEFVGKPPSPLSKEYSGVLLCIHCAPPSDIVLENNMNIRILATRQIESVILYCRSSVEIGKPGLLDIYITSCHPYVWTILLIFAICYGGIFHRQAKYFLDFWMGVLGYKWQLTYNPSSLQLGLISLIFLNCKLLCMITTESVSPLPPSRILTLSSFYEKGFKFFAYSHQHAIDLVQEFPAQFSRLGVTDNLTEREATSAFHFNKEVCQHVWPVYCVAFYATKVEPSVSVGFQVLSRFATQNMRGVEYAIDGSAQCDVVSESFSSAWKTFWFKGPGSGVLYWATHALVQAGFHDFWEDFYFTGAERQLGRWEKAQEMAGRPTSSEVVRYHSSAWRFYRVLQLHGILLSACLLYFLCELFVYKKYNSVKTLKK